MQNDQQDEVDDQYSYFRPFKEQPKMEECKLEFEQKDLSPNISRNSSGLMIDFNNQSRITKKESLINKKFLDYIKIKNIVNKFKTKLFEQSKLLTLKQKIKLPTKQIQFDTFWNLNNNQTSQSFGKLIFNSESLVLLIFDKLLLLILIALLLLVPFLWSFENVDSQTLSAITDLGNIFFISDVLIKLNTSIIQKGNIISNRLEIFKLRLKQFISLDALLIGSLNYLDFSNEIIFPIIFFMVGFIKFSLSFDNLIEFLDFSSIVLEIISLIKLLISILLISHFIACIWHYVGLKSFQGHQNSWLSSKNLQNEPSSTQYIYSFYWAIVTMVTVGYGDICPQNPIEVLSATIIMVFSCGVYAFSLNKIGQVVQNLSDLQQLKRESMRTITSYMKHHSISPQLQGKVRNYLEYQFGLQRIQNKIDVHKIINSLSMELRSEIMLNIFNDLTTQTSFFKQNLNQTTIKKLSSLLKLNFYAPGNTISNQDDQNCSIVFVDYGTVSLIEQNSNTILSEFERGNYLGEQAFFTGTPQKFKIASKTFSRIYEIKRSDFKHILDAEEHQKLNEIGQQFQQSLTIKGYKCQICKQSCHNLDSCYLFNYVPNLEKIILRYRLSKQDRSNFRRNNRKKSNCFKNLEKIVSCQNDFVINEEDQGSLKNQKSEQSIQDTPKDEQNSKNSLLALNQKQESSRPSLQVQHKMRLSFDKNDSIGKKSNQVDPKMLNSDNTKVNSNQFDLLVPGLSYSDQKNSKSYVKLSSKTTDIDQDGFERLKIFHSFFPHNNYDVVIENFNVVNKYLQRKFRSAQKQKINLFENSHLKSESGTQKRVKRKK